MWLDTFRDSGTVYLTNSLLVSVTKDRAAFLDEEANQRGGYPLLTDADMEELLRDDPTFEVHVEEDILEPQALRDWWAGTTGDTPELAMVHLWTSLATSANDARWAQMVCRLLGGGRVVMRDRVGGALGHRAVVYLIHP